MSIEKYRAYPRIELEHRTWPDKSITKAPIWCSVDLRDGNQSLKTPMNLEEKLEFFELLVKIGFKEIEVGFPSSSETEFEFVRTLIEDNLIPEDVTIQVLTQSRAHLIEKTFEAIEGAKRVIFHLYNSTSTLQRQVVFKMNRREIIELAIEGTRQIKKLAPKEKTSDFVFQYSPESFTGTELDFSLDICQAVMDIWNPTKKHKAILNLPATVEMSTPNLYADMIEWFGKHYKNRDSIIISVHTHNDRGTGVAATELALMAGADRVEGTIFGCGERTGNVDIVNLALNLFSQGVDPKLDFSDINRVATIYQKCTNMPIHPRHPYVGELVYTAFSGSHQDAIKKGMDVYETQNEGLWAVPYLPIDPEDVGRTYKRIIQINSQSGKGGVAYILEKEFGFKLPKAMHPEFGRIIQRVVEKSGHGIRPNQIFENFQKEYLDISTPISLKSCEIKTKDEITKVKAQLVYNDTDLTVKGEGNGPLDALGNGLKKAGIAGFRLVTYTEHALHQTTSSSAVSYIGLELGDSVFYGVGIDPNIGIASFRAMISALNRAMQCKQQQVDSNSAVVVN
ncbi:2-isopropylmalate synthase [bacterium]|nr:2-isopropylmalate synthase [bacterium]